MWPALVVVVGERENIGSALTEMAHAAQVAREMGETVISSVLMLHGECDLRVPVEQARGFRRGLEYWGLPFEYAVYPREGHLFKEVRHVRDMGERLLRFVER